MRLALPLLVLAACQPAPSDTPDDDDWFGGGWESDADTDADTDSDTDTDTDTDTDDDPPDDPDDDPDTDPGDGPLESGFYSGVVQMSFVAEAAGEKRDCAGEISLFVEAGTWVFGDGECVFTTEFLGHEQASLSFDGADEDEGDLVGEMGIYLGDNTMDGAWYGGGGEEQIWANFDGWDLYNGVEMDLDVEWSGDFRAVLD